MLPHAPERREGRDGSAPAGERPGAGGRAAPDSDLIEKVLRGFMVGARMLLLYPPGHNRVSRRLAEIRQELGELIEIRGEPLELTVAGHRLVVGESRFDQFSEVGERFAVLLRHRQIRSVVLRRGVTEEEIRLLVEILRIDHRALLRVGGTKTFADQKPHPHIELHLFEAGGTGPVLPSTAAATPQDGSSPLENEGLPSGRGPDAEPDAEVEEQPIYSGRQADTLNDVLADPSDQERFEQQLEEYALKEILDGQKPDEEAVAFNVNVHLLENDEIHASMEGDARVIRERFRRHSSEQTSLRILFRMLSEAEDEAQYRLRRRMLLQAVRDPRFFTGELVLVIRHLVEDGGNWGFERGEELAQSVIAYVNDAAAVTQLLASIPLVPEVAQGVLSSLAAREDALPLLARLLTSQLPAVVADDLPRVFIQAADADSKRFLQWALHDRKTLLRPSVVRILLEDSPSLLVPVCERLLLERPDRDRRKLIHLLCSNGREEALRLLARAVRSCGRGVAIEALQALGRFPHQLALEVLREVVDRNNNEDVSLEEAEAAVFSLYDLGLKEAHAFLWEIIQARRSLFSYAYVRPLRLLAENALQGTTRP